MGLVSLARSAAVLAVDVVLVPKYSTDSRSTIFALTEYGGYLAVGFPEREETRSWTILSRPTRRRG